MSIFNKFLDKTIRKKPHGLHHSPDMDHIGETDSNDAGHDEQPKYESRSGNTAAKHPAHFSELSTVSSGSNGSTVVNGDSTGKGQGQGQSAPASPTHHLPTASLEHLSLNSPQSQPQFPSQPQQEQEQEQEQEQQQSSLPQKSDQESDQNIDQNSDQNNGENSTGLLSETMQTVEMVPAEANLSERQQLEQQQQQLRQQQEQLQQQALQQQQQQQQPQQVPQIQQHSSIQQSAQAQVQQQQQQQQQQTTTRRKFNLDDFRIHRTLGTGSFGRVHLVQSRYNSRFYAMKVLKKSEVVRLRQVEHTNNEKMILERVEHPFLINLWGTFQDVRNLYMVMDYVVGGELFSVLRKSQRFPEHVSRFYTCEVLLALEYLHSHAVIYRDLKPENLLLDSMGHIKITDFGFAKHVPQNMTWTLCGTPDYLAPEIIQSKGYGKAVDWWSMGVLMFEMCAGFPPFFDEDHIKLYGKIMAGKVRYPSHFSPPLKDLLKRLLTADLTKRYGNLRGGAADIKHHVWFEGINWDQVYSRQIEAPYRPTVHGEGDASNFDDYPEDAEQYGVYPPGETDDLGSYFPGF